MNFQNTRNIKIFLDLYICGLQSVAVTRPMDAAQRVRERLQEWLQAQGHGSKTMLAKAIQANYGDTKSRSWVTGLVKKAGKRQDLRLRDLDAVAELMGVPPGELVRKHDRNYLELTMEESRMIAYCRALPAHVRAQLVQALDFMFKPHMDALELQSRERAARTLEARTREQEGARTTESGTFRTRKAR